MPVIKKEVQEGERLVDYMVGVNEMVLDLDWEITVGSQTN